MLSPLARQGASLTQANVLQIRRGSGTLFGWLELPSRRPETLPQIEMLEQRRKPRCLLASVGFTRKGSAMDENRLSGTAKNIGGKLEEGIGQVTGDTKTQAEGIARQVSGAAQDLYGQARDAASDVAGTARGTASSFEKLLRNTIETQPYTSALVALGIGWLLGRMHRPL
jgi:uncharacterized protein YjbJ (UPF0337 family)